jgi:lysyl-tRNA synthetase class I
MSNATKPSAVIDTRVIYCGDNLDQLRKLPEACVDLIYIAGRGEAAQLLQSK